MRRTVVATTFIEGDRTPASTISTAWVEFGFSLHVVALFLLTRFRSKGLLWRNLIRLFRTVNSVRYFFFAPGASARMPHRPGRCIHGARRSRFFFAPNHKTSLKQP